MTDALPHANELYTDVPLTEQEPIQESRNQMVWQREQLKDLVEAPLLAACEDLYDKNIRTLSTSANKKDASYGHGHMIIEVDSMSPENVSIARSLAQQEGFRIEDYDKRQTLIVEIPLDTNTTTAQVERRSLEVADSFKKQPLKWSPVLTLAQLKASYGVPEDNSEYDDSQVWVAEGFYYDPDSDRYYLSEEHFRKIKEFE